MQKIGLLGVSLFSLSVFAQSDYEPVDLGLSGARTKSHYCERYIKKNPPPRDQVDYIILDEHKAYQSKNKDENAVFSIETSTLPAVCEEVAQRPGEDGFLPGYMLEMKGVAPAPTDFILAIAGFDKHYSILKRNGALEAFGSQAAWSDILPRESDGKYRSKLTWRVKDILRGQQWKDFLAGKPVRLVIPTFYCTTDLKSYEAEGKRPKFAEFRIGEFFFRLMRPLRPKTPVEQYCFYFPTPITATLNSDGNSETPEFFGPSKVINDRYNEGKAPSEQMEGWWSGRCYDIAFPEQERNALLVAGTHRFEELVFETPTKREIFEMHIRGNSKEKANYFDALKPKQVASLKQEIADKFKSPYGMPVSFVGDSAQHVRTLELEGETYYRVRQVGNDYIARAYFVPNRGSFEKDAEQRGVCQFTKKVN